LMHKVSVSCYFLEIVFAFDDFQATVHFAELNETLKVLEVLWSQDLVADVSMFVLLVTIDQTPTKGTKILGVRFVVVSLQVQHVFVVFLGAFQNPMAQPLVCNFRDDILRFFYNSLRIDVRQQH
jgi:hypothetical protein